MSPNPHYPNRGELPSSKPSQSGKRSGGAKRSSGQTFEYPLPCEVVEVFKKQKEVSNPGLIFERFVPFLGEQEKTRRTQALEAAQKAPDRGALTAAYQRWEALARANGAEIFTLKTDWRFIPGLGRKNALKIGFSFHRYGFPYLPGSSVKGIARTWALYELASRLKKDANTLDLNELDQTLALEESEFKKAFQIHHPGEEEWLLASAFRAVFGTLKCVGGAVFFDAIPIQAFALDLDIMNPHYTTYYQGKEPPVDWHHPNLITFLAVPAGKEFAFAVAWRRGAPNPELLKRACVWLKRALRDLGAGAKTSAGYGYFTATSSEETDDGSLSGR